MTDSVLDQYKRVELPNFANDANPSGLGAIIEYVERNAGAESYRLGASRIKGHPGFKERELRIGLQRLWDQYVREQTGKKYLHQSRVNMYLQGVPWGEENIKVLVGHLRRQYESLNALLGIRGFHDENELEMASGPTKAQLDALVGALKESQEVREGSEPDWQKKYAKLLEKVRIQNQYKMILEFQSLENARKAGLDITDNQIRRAISDMAELAMRQYGVQAISNGNVNPNVLMSMLSQSTDAYIRGFIGSREINKGLIDFGNAINEGRAVKEYGVGVKASDVRLIESSSDNERHILTIYEKYFTPDHFPDVTPSQLKQMAQRAAIEFIGLRNQLPPAEAFNTAGNKVLPKNLAHYSFSQQGPGTKILNVRELAVSTAQTMIYERNVGNQRQVLRVCKKYFTSEYFPGISQTRLDQLALRMADQYQALSKSMSADQAFFVAGDKSMPNGHEMPDGKRMSFATHFFDVKKTRRSQIWDIKNEIDYDANGNPISGRQLTYPDKQRMIAEFDKELNVDWIILNASRQKTRRLQGMVTITVSGKTYTMNQLARLINRKILTEAQRLSTPFATIAYIDEEDVMMNLASRGDWKNLQLAFDLEDIDIDKHFAEGERAEIKNGMRSLQNGFRSRQEVINGILGKSPDLKEVFEVRQHIGEHEAQVLRRAFRIVTDPRGEIKEIKDTVKAYQQSFYRLGEIKNTRITIHRFAEIGNGVVEPASWLAKGTLIGSYARPVLAGAMWKAIAWRSSGNVAKATVGRAMIRAFKLGSKIGLSAVPFAGQALGAYFLIDMGVNVVKKIPIVKWIAKPLTWAWDQLRGATLGAISGATIGFAIGTFVPVIGNVVGAVAGGIIGGVAGFAIQHTKNLAKVGSAAWALYQIMWHNLMSLLAGHMSMAGNLLLGAGVVTGNPILIASGGLLHLPQAVQGLQWLAGKASGFANSASSFLGSFTSGGITTTVVTAPLAGLGVVMYGSMLTTNILVAAFALPPFEQATSFLAGGNGAPPEECTGNAGDYPVHGMPSDGQITQTTFSEATGTHSGDSGNSIDIDGVIGDVVTSTMDGEVVIAGWDYSGYGNLVKISGTGKSSGFITYYGHLSAMYVNVGDLVVAGKTQIGEIGNTGNVVKGTGDGSHLHYELRPAAGSHQFDLMCTLNL